MKKRILPLLILSAICLGSCSDWLSVEPKNQIGKDKLYAEESGFQNALNGIYQLCAQPSLYGKSLSWGALSAMAQQYENSSLSDYTDRYFGQYLYENSSTILAIDNIWSGLYNAVANCNLLLNEIEEASPSLFVLDTITRNVIKGEALALRAFCHMDIYRLFAPAPVKNNKEVLLPYQEVYPSEWSEHYTAAEGMDRAIEDLLLAKDLLAYNDTTYHLNQMRYGMAARIQGQYLATGGSFFNNRGYRMNYCAVIGLLARAYHYKGDMENARKYAYMIYKTFYKTKAWFKFNSANDYSTNFTNKQKKHLEDCLFAFYNNDLLSIVESYYQSGTRNMQDIEEIFKNDEDDYRRYLVNMDGNKFTYCIKYRQTDNYQRDNVEGKAIPILRLQEIYHILIETNFDSNPDESLRLFRELRSAMGCKRQLSEIGSKEDLYKLLINDARREFMGEGVLFYYYKRLNRGILIPDGELEPKESVITLPVPDSQNV